MGGALIEFKKQGFKTGICDLTQGESGTYGSAKIRLKEIEKANEILNIDVRETLKFPDGDLTNTKETKTAIVEIIRKHRPEIIFSFVTNNLRHPDHKQTGQIVEESIFIAGLEKIKTNFPAFRPSSLIKFPELITYDKPDFVIDITNSFEEKIKAIRAYGSQVTAKKENDENAKTFLRSNRFWEVLTARAIMAGSYIGVRYGEPFFSNSPVKVTNILEAFRR
jgi:bacillithiol biosynthesis deacetylase BshB1